MAEAPKEQVIKDLDGIIGLIGKDTKDITPDEKKEMVKDTWTISTTMSARAG